ncbi:hypothetical protein ACJ41O_002926 [Fusarium nematophilum]
MAAFNSHIPGATERSMSSSLSPERGVASSEDDRAATSALDPEFYKNLADKRTSRDGNPPKKRGPKPNSKPALTRRQELNRQAQRTHRERKELYIKALEDEVLRLKEVFSNVSLDRERLAEENKRLRDVLAQAGLQLGSPFAAGSASSHGPDLSKKLDLDGEVTPIMAWGMLISHPRALDLEVEDFRKLSEELVRKVRCYGFGAVMEEFEVRDAMDNLFGGKDTLML